MNIGSTASLIRRAIYDDGNRSPIANSPHTKRKPAQCAPRGERVAHEWSFLFTFLPSCFQRSFLHCKKRAHFGIGKRRTVFFRDFQGEWVGNGVWMLKFCHTFVRRGYRLLQQTVLIVLSNWLGELLVSPLVSCVTSLVLDPRYSTTVYILFPACLTLTSDWAWLKDEMKWWMAVRKCKRFCRIFFCNAWFQDIQGLKTIVDDLRDAVDLLETEKDNLRQAVRKLKVCLTFMDIYFY